MLPVMFFKTIAIAVAHYLAFTSVFHLIVCFATRGATGVALFLENIAILYWRLLIGPNSLKNDTKPEMRVYDFCNFPVFLRRFTKIHGCPFDGPTCIDTILEPTLETAKLRRSEICENCLYLPVFELKLKSSFKTSNVLRICELGKGALIVIMLVEPLAKLLLIRGVVD